MYQTREVQNREDEVKVNFNTLYVHRFVEPYGFDPSVQVKVSGIARPFSAFFERCR